MAVDPNTGRIITSASLTIAEADAKRVPRNAALGPSRTAQERKQIRTAFLAAWEGLADNPVIADIIDELSGLTSQSVYTADSTDGGYFLLPLPRVENEDGDPRYYAITYMASLRVNAISPGSVDVSFDFDGLLEAHGLAAEVWISQSAFNAGNTADYYHYYNNTPGDVEWSIPYESNVSYIDIRITGRIAPISDNFIFDLILTTNSLTNTLSAMDSGVLTTQLTNQAFS